MLGLQAEDLEAFLFGSHGDAASVFEKEKDEMEETVAELIHKVRAGARSGEVWVWQCIMLSLCITAHACL